MAKTMAAADFSIEDLQAALNEKMSAEKNALKEKREAYEKERTDLIYLLGADALAITQKMDRLKKMAMKKLIEFREKMIEYGDLRKGEKNKGNFEIKNDRFKIQFISQIVKKYDERALMAEEKMNMFLNSFVKKRDKKLYEFISSLMKRNEATGDFDHDMISRLYSIEDQYDDVNWKEALRLFKESYSPTTTTRYVRFSVALPDGGWEPIVLDFAKLKSELAELQDVT